MEIVMERVHLDVECTEVMVKQEATWCHKSMSRILNATSTTIRIFAILMRWWNADIKERRNAVGTEKRKSCNSEEAAQGQAALQKLIQLSKISM